MTRARPPLGAHVSTAGGVDRALERARRLGCEAIQIFVKSPQQWRSPRLGSQRAAAFRAARAASGISPAVAHAAYLVNLAARDRNVLRRSRRALASELERCERLGLDGLIVHPGAHMGSGEARGIRRVAASLRQVLERHPDASCPLLLELTAGQGTVLGHRLEQLAEMRELSGHPERVAVCVDTCHAFAAGYPLHRPRGYEAFWRELEQGPGREVLRCLHLNDSMHPLGSRRDRHANLGEGEIGPALFRRLVRDRRLRRVPMILETPLGEDRKGHERDLEKLMRWRGASPRASG